MFYEGSRDPGAALGGAYAFFLSDLSLARRLLWCRSDVAWRSLTQTIIRMPHDYRATEPTNRRGLDP